MNNDLSFETARLWLRPTCSSDAAFMFHLMNTPKWLQYIGDRKVYAIQDAESYINQRLRPQFDRLGFSNYTLFRKPDNIPVGTCGFFDREGLEGIDIGFALLPEFEKQGYAYESAVKLLHVAHEIFNLSEVYAITTKDNFSSQKLLQRLGLNYLRATKLPDDKEELLLYRCSLP